MKRLLVTAVSLFLTAWLLLSGQNMISGGEYWIDGQVANAVSLTVSASREISVSEDIDVSFLKDGLHRISFRFMDDSARWNPVVSRYFVKTGDLQYGVPQELQLCEYWIDNAYGDAVRIPIPNQPLFSLSEDLDISYLKHGLHILNVRLKDSGDRWSPAVSRFFVFLEEDITINSQLSSLEYWIDRDITNKRIIPVDNGQQLVYLDDIDVSGLKSGLHTVTFRIKNMAGSHSAPFTRFFVCRDEVSSYTNNQLAYMEYWIDERVEQSVRIEFQDDKEISLIDDLNLSFLKSGVHRLSFRFVDAYGNREPAVTRFMVHFPEEILAATDGISAYRYWIDDLEPHIVYQDTPGKTFFLMEEIDMRLISKGEYTLNIQVCDDLGRWSGTVYDTVLKNAFPFAEIVKDTMALCLNDSMYFKALIVDADTLTWHFGDGQTSADSMPAHGYAQAGSFQVSLDLTDTTSKVSNTYFQEGEISIFDLPLVELQDTVEICEGDEASIEGPGSMSEYHWSNNTSGQSIMVSSAGEYSLLVKDSNGCSNTDTSLVIVHDLPLLSMPDTVSISDTSFYLADAGEGYMTYLWNGLDGAREEIFYGEELGIGNHFLLLEVRDENNCTGRDTTIIVVKESTGIAGSEVIQIMLYPNPARDFIHISGEGIGTEQIIISILDLKGKKLFEQVMSADSLTIPVDHLPSGTYFISLGWKDENRILKFIKH